MQRILFVGQTGELGGAELVLLDIARHYRRHCEVLLLADGPLHERLRVAGVRTRVLAGRAALLGVSRQGGRLRALAALPEVMRMAFAIARASRDCDVLYPNSQKAAVVTMIAGALARRPVVWHLHDILSREHFAGTQRRAVIALANLLARRVIANSTAARDAYVAAGGCADRVAVVTNGLDASLFDAVSDDSTAALRHTLGLSGVKLVGLFGRISPWKGQHVLVEALALLPGVHALVVGDAMFGEVDYKRAVLARASELGVASRLHWLGFRDDVPALMRAVDVVVHASTAPEPFGRVIVEGMLAGRPVLATEGGASAELLGAGHPGLVPPGDPAALARAVTDILAAPTPVLVARTTRDRARAVALFSLERMLSRIDREVATAVAPERARWGKRIRLPALGAGARPSSSGIEP